MTSAVARKIYSDGSNLEDESSKDGIARLRWLGESKFDSNAAQSHFLCHSADICTTHKEIKLRPLHSFASESKLRRRERRSPPPPESHQDPSEGLPTSSKTQSLDRPQPPPKDVAVTHFPLAPAPLPKYLLSPSFTPMSLSSVRLLVASLGNPPPYQSTRHSAGHLLLRALASHLSFPPLINRSREYGNGYLSAGEFQPEYTLWQSTSMMNGSGPSVLKAWKAFADYHKSSSADQTITALVVLHDELETSPGTLKLKRGEGSAKGHNGIKSVQSSLASAGALNKMSNDGRFIKIGVGIGRPLSRERDDVSGYVLGQVTGQERAKIEGAASQLVGLLDGEVQRLSQVKGQ